MIDILPGDCRTVLPTLPAGSVQCVVTSPPYWGLRDYGVVGQLGLEPTPEEYVAHMVGVFRAVRRVLRDDGTCWVNMGDSYASDIKGSGGTPSRSPLLHGSRLAENNGARGQWYEPRRVEHGLKQKDLVGMPWRLAFALQADGWYLRADIIWAKPNPMPESVTDRPTKAHEYVFLLTKSARYYYDADAVREPVTGNGHARGPNGTAVVHPKAAAAPGSWARQNASFEAAMAKLPDEAGRNLRSVWTIPSEPTPEAHFATFPRKLVAPCILAGTSAKGACAVCGTPWAREVDTPSWPRGERRPKLGAHPLADDLAGSAYQQWRDAHPPVTIGWHPTCAHDAAVVPCTVLDPFGGTGTVGRVAEDLGRDSILVELNPAYVEMAEEKTAQYGLFASRSAAVGD